MTTLVLVGFLAVAWVSLVAYAGGPEAKKRSGTEKNIAEAIRKLGSKSFDVRETAHQTLLKIGRPAVKQLRVAAKSSDPEVALRASRLLKPIKELCLQQQIEAIGALGGEALVDETRPGLRPCLQF